MFKFYSIADIEMLDQIVGENPIIRLSSAFGLNDPFEFKFNLELNVDDEIHKQEFFKSNPNSSETEFKDWKEQVRNNDGFLWYNEQKMRAELARRVCLCSFTKNNTNSLMWSHYAGNHTGICVEYDSSFAEYLISNTNSIASNPVKYSKYPPIVNLSEGTESVITKTLFNKQIDWRYEQEHRVVIWSENDVEYFNFPRHFVKAVYLGARMENKLVSRVCELCMHKEISIWYGVALGNSYDVTFKEYQPSTYQTRSFWN